VKGSEKLANTQKMRGTNQEKDTREHGGASMKGRKEKRNIQSVHLKYGVKKRI